MYKEKYVTSINLVTNELNKLSLTENIIVYRCTSYEVLKIMGPNKLYSGCILNEKAFMSTTLNIDSYINGLSKNDQGKYNFDIILKILVPKGSKGAYVGLINQLKFEQEFLFPPNQKLIYIRKESSIKGKKVLLCKML